MASPFEQRVADAVSHHEAGRLDQAEAAYRVVAEAFRVSGWGRVSFTTTALLDHAELLARMGRREEAARQLAAAEEILGEQTGERAARIAQLRALVPAAR